jgi:hypothetical protein
MCKRPLSVMIANPFLFYFILIKKAYKGGPESWNWKKKQRTRIEWFLRNTMED